MEEFKLSLMQRGDAPLQLLQPALERFKATLHRMPFELILYDWAQGRAELIRAALYHHGADVSEIGTTWISDLIAMNALRPFTPAEIDLIGPANAFIPAAWRTTRIAEDSQIWSIPWLCETFTLHYRKDLLEKAGIDERNAFATPEQLFTTASRLRDAGYDLPIALPPTDSRTMLLHVAASWVWQEGGEFMSPDNKSVAFNEPAAVRGLSNYFRLLQTISPAGLNQLNTNGVLQCFTSGDVPMAIGGPWLHPRNIRNGSIDASDWSVTRLPGPPFVGGTNLVIWQHTRHNRDAVNLIKLLSSDEATNTYAYSAGILPTRTRALLQPPFSEDRFNRVAFESLQVGRSYPNFTLWGLVEEKLVNALTSIANAVCGNPLADPEEIISRILNQVARTLNITLEQR